MIVGFPILLPTIIGYHYCLVFNPCISLDSAHVRGFTKNGYISLNVCIPDIYELKYFRGANFVPFLKAFNYSF